MGDIEFDPNMSTVRIGNRAYPCCQLICPQHPNQHDIEDVADLSLGGVGRYSSDGYIPMENGALVYLNVDTAGGRISAGVHALYTEFNNEPDDALYLPAWLKPDRGRLRPGFSNWDRCEVWWLHEHIDRLSTMQVVRPTDAGPDARMVPWGSIEWSVAGS